jgi:hypothetical protein
MLPVNIIEFKTPLGSTYSVGVSLETVGMAKEIQLAGWNLELFVLDSGALDFEIARDEDAFRTRILANIVTHDPEVSVEVERLILRAWQQLYSASMNRAI